MVTPLSSPFDALDEAAVSTAAREVDSLAEQREALGDLLPLLYRQVRSLAGPRVDLDDLVQLAAERALRALPNFEGRCALSTWTYTIAFRVVQDQERWFGRWRRRFAFEDEQPGVFETSQDPREIDALVAQKARARRLHLALAELPPKKRAVIVLHDLEELPLKEVAEIVGCNMNTLKSRLRDARRKLAEALSADPLFASEANR